MRSQNCHIPSSSSCMNVTCCQTTGQLDQSSTGCKRLDSNWSSVGWRLKLLQFLHLQNAYHNICLEFTFLRSGSCEEWLNWLIYIKSFEFLKGNMWHKSNAYFILQWALECEKSRSLLDKRGGDKKLFLL